MKIQGQTFDNLQSALFDTLAAHNLHPFMVQNTRHAWQVFHRACDEGRVNLNGLYASYDNTVNDSHIETALNKIFKAVRG